MATFKVGPGFSADFYTTPIATANGAIIVADAHLIRISVDRVADGFENYIGDFTYTPEGLPLGTVNEYRFETGSELIYIIADADIDVLALRNIATLNDPQKFLEYIFRSDDRVIGESLPDVMVGYAGDDDLRGKMGDDGLEGRDGDDVIFGGKGRDILFGGAGDDWLKGGRGSNTLTGGDADDTFVFTRVGKPSTVTDFTEGDQIALGFAGLGPGGPLSAASFHVGGEATTQTQRIVYDIDTGWLLYARNGSDTSHPEKFARIGKGLEHIGADDFIVM